MKTNEQYNDGRSMAMGAYLDKYELLHTFGQDEDGNFNFDEEKANERTKELYAISVNIEDYKLRQVGGFPEQNGERIVISRNADGKIVEKNGIEIDAVWKEIYELAEAKKKEVLGK